MSPALRYGPDRNGHSRYWLGPDGGQPIGYVPFFKSDKPSAMQSQELARRYAKLFAAAPELAELVREAMHSEAMPDDWRGRALIIAAKADITL
jgi:hypothetical protein